MSTDFSPPTKSIWWNRKREEKAPRPRRLVEDSRRDGLCVGRESMCSDESVEKGSRRFAWHPGNSGAGEADAMVKKIVERGLSGYADAFAPLVVG